MEISGAVIKNIDRKRAREEEIIKSRYDTFSTQTSYLLKIGMIRENYKLQCQHHSNNFLNLIQSIIVCRHICIVNFVEPHHNWVACLWVLPITNQ